MVKTLNERTRLESTCHREESYVVRNTPTREEKNGLDDVVDDVIFLPALELQLLALASAANNLETKVAMRFYAIS